MSVACRRLSSSSSPGLYRYRYKPPSRATSSFGWGLTFNSTLPSFAAFAGVIPNIRVFSLFNLVTAFWRYFTQIFESFLGFCSSCASWALNSRSARVLLKRSINAVKLWWYFVVAETTFTSCYFISFKTPALNSVPLSTWSSFGYFSGPFL